MPGTSTNWDDVSSPVQTDKAPVDQATGQLGNPVSWDDVSTLHDSGPTDSQRVGTMLKGVTGGALETGGAVGGMAMGAAIGALGGPAAPLTVPLGAAVGGFAGYMAGKTARKVMSDTKGPISGEPLSFNRVEDLPEGLRPFGIAGEVLGSGASVVGATNALAQSGARLAPSLAGNFINRILDTAQRSPAMFNAVEISSLAGSAVGGGAAEEFFPGNLPARIGGEMAGGFFNFPRMATGVSHWGARKIVNIVSLFSRSAAETNAARVLQNAVKEAGGDPEMVAKILKEADIPGLSSTAAQKSADPGLAALEKDLMEQSREFGNTAHKAAQDSMDVLGKMVNALKGTGDPQALRAAAELRAEKFRILLQSSVDRAQDDAVKAAAGISKDNPEDMARLSVVARDILDTSLKKARTVESGLWDKVDETISMAPSNLLQRHAELRGGMLPREKMPDVIEGTIVDLQQAGKLLAQVEAGKFPPPGTQGAELEAAQNQIRNAEAMFTSGFIKKFRTRALAQARELASVPGKSGEARLYGELAQAALDDLNVNMGAAGAGEALDDARAFSKALHDTFTRTFAGAAQRSGRTGADRLPPELLLRSALGTGKEAAALKLQELEEATRFLPSRDLGGPEAAQNVDIMLDAQQRILRLAAANSIDTKTGLVSATGLRNFLRNNAELVNRFPSVKADLEAAITNADKLKAVNNLRTNATRITEKKAAFAAIAKVENPGDAVTGAILRSPTPIQNLSNMARLARNSGPEAVEGLKASVWDFAMQRAERQGGNYMTNIINNLTKPIRPGLPSVVQVMQREGILSPKDVDSLTKLIDRAQKIGEAMATPGKGDLVAGDQDVLVGLLVRVAGARMGSAIAGMMGGGNAGMSLIAAGQGSSFARSLFQRLPAAKVRDVIAEALSSPEFAAKLLEKNTTQAGKIQQAMQLHAYMVQAGLVEPITMEDQNDTVSPAALPQTQQEAPVNPAQKAAAAAGIAASVAAGPAAQAKPDLFGFDATDNLALEAPVTDNSAVRSSIQQQEGRHPEKYKDHQGIPTIGIGFNLKREDAPALIAKVGADYKKVMAGTQQLTEAQIDHLFDLSYGQAVKDARQLLPHLETYSPARQEALIDMSYNMGLPRLQGFGKMLRAIREGNWEKAAQEVLDSEYAKEDVPERAKINAEKLRSGG